MKVNGSAVRLNSVGILILGKPGSGKSSLAFQLISYGADWIADGTVDCTFSLNRMVVTGSAPVDFTLRYPTIFQVVNSKSQESEVRKEDNQLVIRPDLNQLFPLQTRVIEPVFPDIIIWTERTGQNHSSLYPVPPSELWTLVKQTGIQDEDIRVKGWKFISGADYQARIAILDRLNKLTSELGFHKTKILDLQKAKS